MTLRPSEDFAVRGHPGKPYEVNEICAAPGCGMASVHAHHIWSRAHLRNEPYEWVQLPDGTVIGNRTGLCFTHHEWVTGILSTGHKARILFRGGVFWWEEKNLEEWDSMGLLDPQPPGAARREPPSSQAREETETCPTCGSRKRRADRPRPARKAKTWTLTVPDDTEIGADVLDGWVDDLAAILGLTDETSRLRRYHTLAVALAWLNQNRADFARDIAEASERLEPERAA